jgi:ATP-dependent helicase HepA
LTDPGNCRVLVCDAAAEEGLNLQGGLKVAVHLDLPASANRVEQRMGRLDRFGTGQPVRSIVIVDAGNPAEAAWVRFLNEGLEVFDQSMASLQYLVEATRRELIPQWLGAGLQALYECTERLAGPQGQVARERQRIDQQDMLDSLCEAPSNAFDVLEQVDGEWRAWGEAFHGFAGETLQLAERSTPWTGLLDDGNQVFRMGYSLVSKRPTLFPLPSFIEKFRGSIDTEAEGFDYRHPYTGNYSFKRQTGRTQEGRRLRVRPLRFGDEFVEGLVSFCQTDDRGRSFAMWRHFPGYESMDGCGSDLYFRFDFLVEADLDGLEGESDQGPDLNSITIQSLRRRADGHLPPEYVSVWVDANGVASESAPEEAACPYRPRLQGDGGRDFNLNPMRWKEVHEQSNVPWLTTWPALCRSSRQTAQAYVQTLPRVRQLIDSALVTARAQHTIRQAQITSRISRLTGAARTAEIVDLGKEAQLQETLLSAIATPALRLDVAGAVFISASLTFV